MSVGRILKPHGVRGELKVEPYTPEPERFAEFKRVFAVSQAGEREELTLETCRLTAGVVLIKFAGYDAPETAAALNGRVLEIPRAEAREPPPGQVLYADMIGLQALDAVTGRPIGRVKAIVTAGNDLLEIETPEGDVLIPWVPEFVDPADLTRGTVTIRPIPGLLEL